MTFRKILAASMISAAAFGATDAMASGRHGGYHGGGHGYHGGHYSYGYNHGYGRVGAFVGGAIVAGALLSPWYYSPYYAGSPYYAASYPTVVEVWPPAPMVYMEQSQAVAPAASDAGNWWYFCNDTRAYYPYVKECASPWQRVSPTPSAPR